MDGIVLIVDLLAVSLSCMALVCDRKTNKEIAMEMNNHIANIFEKMNINSRIDLVKVIKTGPWS